MECSVGYNGCINNTTVYRKDTGCIEGKPGVCVARSIRLIDLGTKRLVITSNTLLAIVVLRID